MNIEDRRMTEAVEAAARAMFLSEHGDRWGGPDEKSNLAGYVHLVNVALPHLRAMFAEEVAKMLNKEGDSWNDKAAAERHMGIRSSDRANTLWLMADRVRNYGKGRNEH